MGDRESENGKVGVKEARLSGYGAKNGGRGSRTRGWL